MDYFTALTIFHNVADSGSFSQTARALDLAVSSVTRQIDQLEAALGVALFSRSTRKLALTPLGEQYRQATLPILQDLAQANSALKQTAGEPQGRLKITAPPDLINAKLAPILAEFAAKYPKISLEVYAADDFIDLVQQGFDLAVRIGKIHDEALIAKPLAAQRRLLCASPAYLEQYGMPLTPADLQTHNCLLYQHRGYAPKWYFQQCARQESINIQGNLAANSTALLRTYAKNGLGIAHLPDWLIQADLAQKQLISLLPDWQITPSRSPQDEIYLVYPPNSRNVKKVELLAALLQTGLNRN